MTGTWLYACVRGTVGTQVVQTCSILSNCKPNELNSIGYPTTTSFLLYTSRTMLQGNMAVNIATQNVEHLFSPNCTPNLKSLTIYH